MHSHLTVGPTESRGQLKVLIKEKLHETKMDINGLEHNHRRVLS